MEKYQSLCAVHGNRPDSILPQMLCNFQDKAWHLVLGIAALLGLHRDLEGIQDWWKIPVLELNIHNGPNYALYLAVAGGFGRIKGEGGGGPAGEPAKAPSQEMIDCRQPGEHLLCEKDIRGCLDIGLINEIGC